MTLLAIYLVAVALQEVLWRVYSRRLTRERDAAVRSAIESDATIRDLLAQNARLARHVVTLTGDPANALTWRTPAPPPITTRDIRER